MDGRVWHQHFPPGQAPSGRLAASPGMRLLARNYPALVLIAGPLVAGGTFPFGCAADIETVAALPVPAVAFLVSSDPSLLPGAPDDWDRMAEAERRAILVRWAATFGAGSELVARWARSILPIPSWGIATTADAVAIAQMVRADLDAATLGRFTAAEHWAVWHQAALVSPALAWTVAVDPGGAVETLVAQAALTPGATIGSVLRQVLRDVARLGPQARPISIAEVLVGAAAIDTPPPAGQAQAWLPLAG